MLLPSAGNRGQKDKCYITALAGRDVRLKTLCQPPLPYSLKTLVQERDWLWLKVGVDNKLSCIYVVSFPDPKPIPALIAFSIPCDDEEAIYTPLWAKYCAISNYCAIFMKPLLPFRPFSSFLLSLPLSPPLILSSALPHCPVN